jgi:hypothetical protein
VDLLDDRLRKKNRFNIAQVAHQFKRSTPVDLPLAETWSYELTGNVLHADLENGIFIQH